MRKWTTTALLLFAVGASAGAPEPAEDLPADRLLRAISLDLRGVVPADEELAAVEQSGDLDLETIDEYLQSPAFTEQVVQHHESITWSRLRLQGFLNTQSLARSGEVWFRPQQARRVRGEREPCSDYPAGIAAGEEVTEWRTVDGVKDEGWVEVSPYWDPDTVLKVCAFDAQAVAVGNRGNECDGPLARADTACGCGPELNWCVTSTVRNQIIAGLSADVSQQVRYLMDTDAPYASLLTSKVAMVNGPLAHFYRHLAPLNSNYSSPIDVESLPTFDSLDSDDWRTVERTAEHSGILTSAGWLLRHQTDRGRANRFYGGFLCRQFIPAETGIGGLEQGTPTPDLTLRTGCRDCHVRLEGWSAYWGRWQPSGSAFLDAETYPKINEQCRQCALTGQGCTQECRRNYVSTETHPDERAYLGWMSPYAFLEGDQLEHPDIGPKGWVDEAVADGSLAQCAATNAAEWLLGPDTTVDEAEHAAWTQAFVDSGYQYRALVRAIVQSNQYRRVR